MNPRRVKRKQASVRQGPPPDVLRTATDLARAVFAWSGAVEVEVLPQQPEPGEATLRVRGAASLPYLERRLNARCEARVHVEALNA